MSNELRNAVAIACGQLRDAQEAFDGAVGEEGAYVAFEGLGQCRAELSAIRAELGDDAEVSPTGQTGPLDFGQVKASLKLASEAASENFRLHLEAMNQAHDDEAWLQAISRLEAARTAATFATQAYQAVLGSEDSVRKSVVHTVKGEDDLSRREADAASAKMAEAARGIETFGDYAPKSRFMQAALHNIARVDHLAANAEQRVVMSVERFGFGLKAMGKRMSAFATMIRGLPRKIAHRAEAMSEPVVRSATASYKVFAGDVADGMRSTQAVAEGAALHVLGAGFTALEKAMQAREAIAIRIQAAEVSVRAAAGVVTGAGRAVADSYEKNKQRVQGEVAARRAGP